MKSETIGVPVVEVEGQPAMKWGAVFGGWLISSGIASLMLVAGLALGFTAFDPYNAEATAKGIGIGSVLWVVLTGATSLFLGGMFASWFDGRNDQTVGALHGLTVWGLSVVATGLLLSLGLTQAIQGGAAIVRGGATVGAAAVGMAAPQMAAQSRGGGPTEEALTELQARLTQNISQNAAQSASSEPDSAATQTPSATSAMGTTAGTGAARTGSQRGAPAMRGTPRNVDRQTMASVASALLKGNTENAKALLAANTTMSQAEIDQTLQNMSAQVEKAKADIKAAADATARYTATVMWVLFFTSLIGLLASGIGGWVGAGHIHRVHHLRRYGAVVPNRL